MILYNLFPLLAGPFSRWGGHFARAAALRFNWVFINPIQRPGASRSLYSISDYFQINPALLDPGSQASPNDQAREMMGQARAAGLKVMLDLVLNHCAIDSPLTRQHPEWFVRGHDGRIANAWCQHNDQKVIWRDLAQFDHAHTRDPEGLYKYSLSVVEHLLALGVEGFRCDAAYQVPDRFWRRLIPAVKGRHPQACFVAETLGCTADQTRDTARAGFDYVFNSSKWWDFHHYWLIEQYNLLRETAPTISFPESHDTARLCQELNGNVAGLRQRYFFSALFSAGVMMPMGFEFGFRKPLHVVNTTPADWERDGIDLSEYIQKVNGIKQTYAVFREESPTTILPSQNPNVLFLWKASARHKDEALLILNKDLVQPQHFQVENLRQFVQAGAPLRDVSPEAPLEYLPEPFRYDLRPGQGMVLVTRRE